MERLHLPSGQTKGIIDHFNEFGLATTSTFCLGVDQLAVDIGSNDGTLLRVFKNAGMRVTGVDPATEIAAAATAAGIPTIPACFNTDTAKSIVEQQGHASLVTAFNVFAHSDDMIGMLEGINHLLNKDGIFAFEVQYLRDILEKKLLGTIFHEHMIHHSVTSLETFFSRVGMQFIKIERVNIQKGSIIGYVARIGSKWTPDASVQSIKATEAEKQLLEFKTVNAFEVWLDEQRSALKTIRDGWNAKKLHVCGYGAARSGPTLAIQLGLEGLMEYLLDDHPMKIFKFAPFEGLQVVPTTELMTRRPDVSIILAWIHTKNIIRQNLQYLKEGGVFLALYPRIQVVDNSNVESFLGNE